MIEPGAVHDGHAAEDEGFTYSMLYLPQVWGSYMLARRGLGDVCALETVFRHTLTDDPLLINAIQLAFMAVHHGEGHLARDQSLDHLVFLLSRHIDTLPQSFLNDSQGKIYQLRDYLHDHMSQNTGLEELSRQCGLDRFRLSRQFKNLFGQSARAYLVRLRLRTARRLLAQGKEPVLVASLVGFSDQSHMGRWFGVHTGYPPAAYLRLRTNVLDRQTEDLRSSFIK